MNRFWKILPASLMCAGLFATTANAQQPDNPGGRGGFPGGPPRPSGERPFEPKVDAQVEAWVKSLIEKITDPHDTIRDSARAAVVTVGKPALPMLQGLANGSDAAKATAARKLIHAIEQPQRPPMMMAAMGGAVGGAFNPMSRRDNANPQEPRPMGERRPETPRPADGERRPAEGERRPDVRPGDGERRPMGGDRRPADGERRPEPRPAEGDRRPNRD